MKDEILGAVASETAKGLIEVVVKLIPELTGYIAWTALYRRVLLALLESGQMEPEKAFALAEKAADTVQHKANEMDLEAKIKPTDGSN